MKNCPICGKPSVDKHKPFCSSRCAMIDLGHWFNEKYAIPAAEDPDDNSAPPSNVNEEKDDV